MNRVTLNGKVNRVQVQKNKYDSTKTDGRLVWVVPSDNSIGYTAVPVWVPQELCDEGLDGLAEKQVATIEGHLIQLYISNQFLYCVELENIHVHKPYREGKDITDRFQSYQRNAAYAARNAASWQKQAEEAKQEQNQLTSRVAQLEQEAQDRDARFKREILKLTTGISDE